MRFLCFLLLVLTTTQLRAQALSDDEKKAGFISLFNGRDFSGWRFQKGSALGPLPKNWSVADGLIQLHGGGSPHLASQWPFDDFDMRFQWKAHKKGYNSGFYVRSGREVNANQINLAEKACGQLINGTAAAKAVPELQKPAGEWNDWRVLAEGDKLTFWCNGKEAWSVSGFKPASGYVGLQAEGAAIDFKNFRIRELGTTVLADLSAWNKSIGWSQEGDVLVAGKNAAPLTSPSKHQNFTLRLEYRGNAGGIAFGADKKPIVAFDHADLVNDANPADQWNYLQVTVAKGKATLWLNGTDFKPQVDVSAETGPIRIVAGDGLRVRNIRIREAK
jgi:hypothetical protein